MQYYTALRDRMRLIDAHEFRDWFANTEIITHDDVAIYKHAFMMYGPEIILTKMAGHLLSGKTRLLFIMFETLRNHSDIFHDLVSEFQVVLNQTLPTGM